MKYTRLLVPIAPILILVFSELVFFSSYLFFTVLALVNLTVLAAILVFLKASKIQKTPDIYFGTVILPLEFLSSVFIYLSLAVNRFFIQFLFLAAAVFIYFYLRYLYYYLVRPEFFSRDNLKNFSSLGNFFIIFFSASAIYGLQSFLNLPVWLLMIVLLVIIFLTVYQIMWVSKIGLKASFPHILIGGVVLFEIGWSISFLPLNHNIAGLALAICYFLLTGLSLSYLKDSLNKKIIKQYLIFGLLAILAVFLTARWM
ncbi:MAG: hypothetical protein PHR36_01745 [Patescibacteria group bacterium]|nr:hypothetical protein [Patescibacteria group bacterium]